jgi:hypothetical protein
VRGLRFNSRRGSLPFGGLVVSTRITYTRCHPLPAYDGPQPVYRAMPQWAGAVPCYVRKHDGWWETAPIAASLAHAQFAACPVADSSFTRNGAVMAFDYYHNTLRAGQT